MFDSVQPASAVLATRLASHAGFYLHRTGRSIHPRPASSCSQAAPSAGRCAFLLAPALLTLLILERQRGGLGGKERDKEEKQQLSVPPPSAVIGWSLLVPRPGSDPTALMYWGAVGGT